MRLFVGEVTLQFNYAAFKRDWQARAAAFGIDPAVGATSYQVAMVKAETVKAAKRSPLPRPQDCWWAEPTARTIWEGWPDALDRPPFVQETVWKFGRLLLAHRERLFMAASDVEIEVIRDIGWQAARLAGDEPAADVESVGWGEFVDLWVEVRRELLDEMTPREREWLPSLRELMLVEAGIPS